MDRSGLTSRCLSESGHEPNCSVRAQWSKAGARTRGSVGKPFGGNRRYGLLCEKAWTHTAFTSNCSRRRLD